MTQPGWNHYEHEADIGIEGIGNSKEDAFTQAAIALTAVITDPENVKAELSVDVHCEAPNDEILFVDWLNALVYEMASQNILFSHFDLTITPQAVGVALMGKAWGEKIDQARHNPVVEIKGATYTTLRVYQDGEHFWHAQTVVDV